MGRTWGGMDQSCIPAGICSVYVRPGPVLCTDVLEMGERSGLWSASLAPLEHTGHRGSATSLAAFHGKPT